MANEDNLIPIEKGELTSEEAKKRGSNGGKASVIARRKKKSMQELAKMMMQMQASPQHTKLVKGIFPDLNPEEITNSAVMVARQMEKAISKNDTRAFESVRDTGGEMPVNKTQDITPIIEVKDEKDKKLIEGAK